METAATSGCFNACNSIIYFNKSSINEYKWDVSSGQELLLKRKLSEIIYDVENTLTNNNNNHLSLSEVLLIIRDASATIRKYISQYIEYLFTEKEKLEYQLTKESMQQNNMTEEEFNLLSNELKTLKQKIEILINCEYVWNVAEIFWIETQTECTNNNSILITLKFLDVMNKFRSPLSDSFHNNIQFDSDEYWKLIYKNAIHGKLDFIMNEIKNFSSDKISHFTQKLISDLCIKCPLYNCLNDDGDNTNIPTKHDILSWKNQVKKVKNGITGEKEERLLRLLDIFLGKIDILSFYCDNNWLDWIYGYLFYNSPFIDHKNELRSLLTLKTNSFNKTEKGSIEWMFGCIMTNEYKSILYYVNAIFPPWFACHLCYFLRRLNTNLVIEWPRQVEDYNKYISQHHKMTLIEWIFEYYVEHQLLLDNESWIWLKNYLHFFKRRGLSMLSIIFENIHIKCDKMAYLMLQTVNEFNLNDNIYNIICLKMAHKSYINNMQYGRITYWCCKCKGKGKGKGENKNTSFNKYLYHLIKNYLNSPTKYINILHDVCDNVYNASATNIKTNKLLNLIFKLRDMYLCRYDLQKLDIKYIKNKQDIAHKMCVQQTPKITPFTKSRGALIDALSKPLNQHNKNLKNIADSFDIADDDIFEDNHNHNHNHNGNESNNIITITNLSTPFPKLVIDRNKKMEQRASTDFLLKNLITPPRPTPSRNGKNSHRTCSLKKSIKKSNKKKEKEKEKFKENEEDKKEDEIEKNYEIECCDIIVSYIGYLMDIITMEIYDLSHFIAIIMFSLPILSHKYSPNAITVNNILTITHKWYKIKFVKNNKKTGIQNFNKNELNLIQEILAHLQSKVLATTYNGKNYAQIWKLQKENNMDQDDDDEEDDVQDDADDDDMVEID